MIQFSCACGKALHAREEYVGHIVRCPQCGRDMAVPAEPGIQAQAAPPRAFADEGPRPSQAEPWQGAGDRTRPRPLSGVAVASLILGLASMLGILLVLVPLSPFFALILAVPAIVLGTIGLILVARSRGRRRGLAMAIVGIVAGVLGGLIAPVSFMGYQRVEEARNRIAASNDLKQIALAMHSYNDSMGGLPPAAICDTKGKPLLSWRVAILPYIEQQSLYRQFHLDEPWDSPNNMPLLAKMPKTYALPGDRTAQPGYTYFRVFVGDHALFEPPQPAPAPGALTHGRGIWNIPDGASQTIMVVEAATAVPWTKPDELPFDPSGPLPPLGGHFSNGFLVVMVDGSVHIVRRNISEQMLRNAIQIDDGQPVNLDD